MTHLKPGCSGEPRITAPEYLPVQKLQSHTLVQTWHTVSHSTHQQLPMAQTFPEIDLFKRPPLLTSWLVLCPKSPRFWEDFLPHSHFRMVPQALIRTVAMETEGYRVEGIDVMTKSNTILSVCT